MLLDYLSLTVSPDLVEDQEALHAYLARCPHLARYIPSTGEVEWDIACRQTLRSDTHAITVYVGSEIQITGSPSRSMGLGNNVFGTLDIKKAAKAHIAAAEKVLGFKLPKNLLVYRVIRVDVTCNYYLGGIHEVRQMLAYLRQSDGGRYKVQSDDPESVYWSKKSRYRSGKAYCKGSHLLYQLKRGECSIPLDYLQLAQGLIRLELKLGGHWWRELSGKHWTKFTPEDFLREYEAYFSGLIGTPEVVDMLDVRTALNELVGRTDILSTKNRVVEITEGLVSSAHRTWCVIQSMGHKHAKASMPKTTWYRHLKLLNAAGLAWGDIAIGQISPIRRRPLILSEPVRSWDDLKKVA